MNIFTKIRNKLTEREDKILLEVDNKYEEFFFQEELIKKTEKLPNTINSSIEKGKIEEKEWEDESKLPFLINKCINVEKNIEYIKTINEKIEKYNSVGDVNIIFEPEDNDSLKEILERLSDFGKLKKSIKKDK